MSTSKFISVISLFLMITAVTGCATYSSWEGQTEMNKNWGKSYAMTKKQQIVNPAAERDLRPVTGLRGNVGARIMDEYIKGDNNINTSSNGNMTIK